MSKLCASCFIFEFPISTSPTVNYLGHPLERLPSLNTDTPPPSLAMTSRSNGEPSSISPPPHLLRLPSSPSARPSPEVIDWWGGVAGWWAANAASTNSQPSLPLLRCSDDDGNEEAPPPQIRRWMYITAAGSSPPLWWWWWWFWHGGSYGDGGGGMAATWWWCRL
jgi:hypothetical protein